MGQQQQQQQAAYFSALLLWPSVCSRVYHSMAKVKLGSKEFDVDSEYIVARSCGVPAADLALFAARVKTGEISRVEELRLVIFFRFCFCCVFSV